MISIVELNAIQTVPMSFKVGDSEFKLIVRQATEDERIGDEGLRIRYWKDTDPRFLKAVFVARERAFWSLVIGWEGVTAKDATGNEIPLPFNEANFAKLLSMAGVREAISNPLAIHMIEGGKAVVGE